MAKKDIDVLSYLFNYYEVRSQINNGKIFSNVVDDINKRLNTSFKNRLNIRGKDYEQSIAAGLYAINSLVFDEYIQDYIMDLLRNNHYYMKKFIKDLIKHLGYAKTEEERESIIDRYLKLWLINNIKYNGVDEYTIESSYGDYSFILADKVIKDDELISYISSGKHKNTCHENAVKMLDYYDAYTVCSLVHSYFVDWYYHSYSYLEHKDMVLDICSNMLMKKSMFDDLYDTREILFMTNDDLRQLYFESVITTNSELEDVTILKSALYLQAAELDKNPKEKKIILDYNNSVLQGIK